MKQSLIYFGVVECIQDPEKLGRCKVRIIGDHTQELAEIPTEDLPWATVLMPCTSASISGLGWSPQGIMVGSWVVVMYADGRDSQQPVIMGTVPGIPIDPADPSIGFNDAAACFPMADKIGEPDTNRLFRGIAGKHVVEHETIAIRKASVMKDIVTASSSWSEPETPYAALYPYNRVWEGPYNTDCDGCNWGHIEEWDSTPGAERYLRWHKTSQNFLEIHPDGKEVHKVYGDNFEIDLNSKHLYIKGDWRITVEGNKDEHIKGDYWQHIEGNFHQIIDKSHIEHTKKNIITRSEEKTIRISEKELYDIGLENIFRKSNKNINDFSVENITAIAGAEATIATGIIFPTVIDPLVPETMTGDSFTDVVGLSCTTENTSITSLTSDYYVKLPDIIFEDEVIAMDQVKVTLGSVYLDTADIQLIGIIHAPYVICPVTSFKIITVLDPVPPEKSEISVLEEIIPDEFIKTEPTTTPIIPPPFINCV